MKLVIRPSVTHGAEKTEIHFSGTSPGREFQVTVSHGLPPQDLSPTALGDAAVCFFLLPAMRQGLALEIQSPVSPVLAEAVPVLQQIYTTWYPDKFPATVQVEFPMSGPLDPALPPSRGAAGCFFSGGVDSFHSTLRHRDRLSHLIFVHGFDIPLSHTDLRREVAAHLGSAAQQLGLPLLEVACDIRSYCDEHVYWGSHYCGAALAAIAHLLTPWVGTVYVPGSMTYQNLEPFGTHIYTDEKWASHALALYHDGMDARRIDKLREITSNPVVRSHLRVCWKNHHGRYNCGECEKCLRTMASLRALGVLPFVPTFPSEINLQALSRLEIEHRIVIPFFMEILEEAQSAGDTALAEAVETCLINGQATLLARELTPLRDLLPQDEIWLTKAAPRFRDAILSSCWETDPEWTRQELARHLTADPDTAFNLLWRHQRGWLLRRWLEHRLGKLNPWRFFRRAAASGKKQTTNR